MADGVGKYRVRCFDVEQGQNIAVLNDAEARKLNIEIGDRVLVRWKNRDAIALADYSRNFIKPGELGLFGDTTTVLKATNGSLVSMEKAQRPRKIVECQLIHCVYMLACYNQHKQAFFEI